MADKRNANGLALNDMDAFVGHTIVLVGTRLPGLPLLCGTLKGSDGGPRGQIAVRGNGLHAYLMFTCLNNAHKTMIKIHI